MKHILGLLLGLWMTQAAFAHNPLLASFDLVQQGDKQWVLRISTAQIGVHHALAKYYKDKDLEKFDEQGYKSLLLQYLKKHINIEVDGKQLQLGKGEVSLGTHQTDISFSLTTPAETFERIYFELDAFTQNEQQHNLLRLHGRYRKEKVFLSSANAYQMEFTYSVTGDFWAS